MDIDKYRCKIPEGSNDDWNFTNGFNLIIQRVIDSETKENEEISPLEMEGATTAEQFLKGSIHNRERLRECYKHVIYMAISRYTRRDYEWFNFLPQLELIKEIEQSDNGGKIVFKNGRIISFSFLSQYLKSFISERRDEWIKFLESKGRIGTCHNSNLTVANLLYLDADVVTGYIHDFGEKREILHTWVETTIGGEKKVMDATFNFNIDKSMYDWLFDVDEKNRISNKIIKADLSLEFARTLDEIGLLPIDYLCNRDAIMEAYNNGIMKLPNEDGPLL